MRERETGLSGTMCLPTGRPMPARCRREEPTERQTTPLPPRIVEAALLSLPAISLSLTLSLSLSLSLCRLKLNSDDGFPVSLEVASGGLHC